MAIISSTKLTPRRPATPREDGIGEYALRDLTDASILKYIFLN